MSKAKIVLSLLQEDQKELFFLRDTEDPLKDLERGFSCEVNSWKDSEEEAIEWQSKYGALRSPLQDPKSKKWCADPERGLSSFAFWDKKSFDKAIRNIERYSSGNLPCIFKSKDYDLDSGADGEDVFRKGSFVKRMKNWEDFPE